MEVSLPLSPAVVEEALVDGELDEVPEQAFLNVGGADSAREKAEQLQRSAGA